MISPKSIIFTRSFSMIVMDRSRWERQYCVKNTIALHWLHQSCWLSWKQASRKNVWSHHCVATHPGVAILSCFWAEISWEAGWGQMVQWTWHVWQGAGAGMGRAGQDDPGKLHHHHAPTSNPMTGWCQRVPMLPPPNGNTKEGTDWVMERDNAKWILEIETVGSQTSAASICL